MTKQTKNLTLITLTAIILGGVVSLAVSSKKIAVPPIVTKPTPQLAQPPPPVEVILDTPKSVSFSYSGTTPSESSLPGFNFFWRRRTIDEILSVAKSLNFAGAPVRKRDGKKTIFAWSTPASNLYLFDNGTTQTWNYVLPLSKETSPTDKQSAEAGKKYFESLFPLPTNVSILLGNEETGPFDGLVIRDIPTPKLRGYYFSFATNGIPISTSSFGMSPLSIIIDSRGVIRTFSFSDPPIIEPNNTHQLISQDDAVASLNKGRGVLISVNRINSYAFFDAPPTITAVSLSSFSLVYYPDNTTQSLLPFYVFEGTAMTQDKTPLRVLYAVSAIAEQKY